MTYERKSAGGGNITEMLKGVWKEYPCASEMRIGDPTDTRKFKAMYANDKEQNVYLITNPATWPEKLVCGRYVKIRPEPELLGKLGDGPKDAGIPWSPKDEKKQISF